MKKLFINAALLVLLAGTFSSCKKKIEDDYQNPELTTKGDLGKLFTGMFMNKRIHPSYWDYYTLIMPYTGAYSGVSALSPNSTMYIPNTNYTDNRWTDFYNGSLGTDYNYSGPGILNNYREMEYTYKTLSPEQQAAQQIYLKLAQVILYDQAAQVIDLWGDIPFNSADSLNADRKIVFAPFDDAATLYNTMIADLKDINSFLDTASVASTISSDMRIYDRAYAGDLSGWQRYANSLRLRLLMRISNVDEATARTEITTMLNNPSEYPLISSNDQDALVWESPSTLVSDMLAVFTDFRYAPQYLLEDVMVAHNDPRLEVFWDKNSVNGFKGFPYNATDGDYTTGGYATYDSATFFYNYNLPGVLFTASEASFLAAEAYERWGFGTAQSAYETGVRQSVEFYYLLNSKRYERQGVPKTTINVKTLTAPTADSVGKYLQTSGIAYDGTTQDKLTKIYMQKWEHFFILQAGQAWAEYRRTGVPSLQFQVSPSAQANPPVRFVYPSNEQLYNSVNYSKVAAKDTRNTKIFWDVN